MLKYGTTISTEFAKLYLIKKKFAEAHENGDIYIQHMEYLSIGTTSCMQINLTKLFKDGFKTGYSYIREPNDIMTYAMLASIAIQANQNEQHGCQSIPAFDYYMAPGILKTFKKQFKQTVYDYLELTDFDKFIAMNGIEREIDKISTIDFDISTFYRFCRESKELERLFELSYKKAYKKTEKLTYQAMEAFIHNLNNIHSRGGAQIPFSTINFGTDISPEGRMVSKSFLWALKKGLGKYETPHFPISIFKVKKGINYKFGEPNYDILELACNVASIRSFPNFAFLDAPFNKTTGDYNNEIAYMGCGTRVLENIIDEEKQISVGRGNLSLTTINLPRLGIKRISNEKIDLSSFFKELEEKMDLVKDQLLERYEIQCGKKKCNFPFLLGQEIWMDSEKLKDTDNLRRVLKHGTLSIGYIGLAECLKALTGKHHGESEEAQKLGLKIIKFMRNKCDEYTQKYNLNFVLMATDSESIKGNFSKLDQAIYGKIKGITDKKQYTTSFQVPENCKISIEQRIKIEAPYHKLSNGGHITHIRMEKSISESEQENIRIIQIMQENGIGYGIIENKVK